MLLMVDGGALELLFWLLVGHAAGDFSLQTDWMAVYKNRHNTDANIISKRPHLIWIHVLTAHSMIHGGLVALITGSLVFGIAEAVLHWLIDFGKSEEWYGFHTDQFLHLSCKFLWFLLII